MPTRTDEAPLTTNSNASNNLIALLDIAQGPNHGYRAASFRGGTFNDLNSYPFTQNRNYSSVKISQITVYHSRLYCMGIQATYEIPSALQTLPFQTFSYKNANDYFRADF